MAILTSNDFYAGPTFPFRIPSHPTIAVAWEATGLVEICDAYLQGKDQGILKKRQYGLAKQAEDRDAVMRQGGIIALVEEATMKGSAFK